MMKIGTVSSTFLGILLVVAGCSTVSDSAEPEAPADNPDADRYAVYSLVLEAEAVDRLNLERLVILDRTTSLDSEQYWAHLIPRIKEELEELQDETLDDFRRRSQGVVGVADSISLSVPIHFIGTERIDELIAEETEEENSGWERFHEEYTGAMGWYVLTEVGFNETRDQALVGFGERSSQYALLSRHAGGEWVVTAVWFRSIS